MRVAVNKLEGVESVTVSLEKGSADIRLKPDNKITLPQIRRVIRSNGYPTKDADITARGRILVEGGQRTLDLLNGSTLRIVDGAKDTPAAIVEITGVSRADDKNEERLTISAIR